MTLDQVNRLIEIIANIAEGFYTDDLMEISGTDTEEPVRTIAQALAHMMENVKAREEHLGMLPQQTVHWLKFSSVLYFCT